MGVRVRSGQVQEVECHCRPASPACLPHLAASIGQRVGLLTGMPARSMSRSRQVRSKVEAREIFEAILANSCEVYELKSGQVAVFDGELGERRPFDLKAWHVEFLFHKGRGYYGYCYCEYCLRHAQVSTAEAARLDVNCSELRCFRTDLQRHGSSGRTRFQGPEHVTPGEYFGAEKLPQQTEMLEISRLNIQRGACQARVL